jgi:hypothetical protein
VRTLSASILKAPPRRTSKDKVSIACATSLALGTPESNFDPSSMFRIYPGEEMLGGRFQDGRLARTSVMQGRRAAEGQVLPPTTRYRDPGF